MPAHDILDDSLFRIVAIDPGTNALGLAVLDADIATGHLFVKDALTIDVARFINRYPQVATVHGDRVAKLYGVERALMKYFMAWQPARVVSEAPYMGRFPQAFGALVECVTAIRRALMNYNRSLPLASLDPATVKKSIGVSGKSGDKEAILPALKKRTDITFLIDVDALDEHARDAIAVGYAYYQSLAEGN